jgi:hypothetical protein|tara:strand:- start:704 stop:931 length:228 start_codon:yes stop_codon:yes gene_type:complete
MGGFTYAILDVVDFMTEGKYDKSKFLNDTYRFSVDKSKVLVRFVGENPQLVNIPLYRGGRIFEILKTNEWKQFKK